MSWEFECLIPGSPMGKGRARATSMGGYVRLYSPKGTAEWTRAAALLMRSEWRRPPSSELVEVEVLAVFPRPKRLMRKKDPGCRLWYGKKPDKDNVDKIVLDSMVMAGVLRDDCQVVCGRETKVYASKEEGPGLYVRMRRVGELPEFAGSWPVWLD